METIRYYAAARAADIVVGTYGPEYRLGPEGCTYTDRDEFWDSEKLEYTTGPLRSVCIVGKIFESLGVALETMEYKGVLSMARLSFEEDGVVMTDKAFLFLDTMQAIQDSGCAWGDAKKYAVAVVAHHQFDSDEKLIRL